MLSIIILSDRIANYQRLKANIEATTLGKYEMIWIDDPSGGIAKAYNTGASRSQFRYLCFVHDDVLFHTRGWDLSVISHLEDQKTGLVGILGGRYKSAFGLGWRDGKTEFYRMNVISRTAGGKHFLVNPLDEEKSEVLCLDGVFICCRKDVWQQFKFDEATFNGFHFYDIDFSFRAAQHYKNYVLYDILIEHFSSGHRGREYVTQGLKFDRKHANILPQRLEVISPREIAYLEGYALTEKFLLMRSSGFSSSERLKILKSYFKKHMNFYQLIRNLYFGFIRP